MDIDFLYYEDCPSHDDALERLRKVLDAERIEARIHVTKVETEQQAQELKFVGSPTIRIEGRDIDTPPEDAYYGLTCRAFRLENGRISPLPSETMIRSALASAKEESSSVSS
ncbi:MAG: hypothetical protein PVI81_05715 [Anaerolineales bacterium]